MWLRPCLLYRLNRKFSYRLLDRALTFDLLLAISAGLHDYYPNDWISHLCQQLEIQPLTDGERYVLQRIHCLAIRIAPMGLIAKSLQRIHQLLATDQEYWLVPGEPWTDAMHNDVADMKPQTQAAWHSFCQHLLSARQSSPSATWLKKASEHIQTIGVNPCRKKMHQWLSLVPKRRDTLLLGLYFHIALTKDIYIHPANQIALRGLIWAITLKPDRTSTSLLADATVVSLKKLKWHGPCAPIVANAALWALGELAVHKDADIRDSAMAQISRLKTRITFKPARKTLEKALGNAAQKSGMSHKALEELGTPAMGFIQGRLQRSVGECHVELQVYRQTIQTSWSNAQGKQLKSIPAKVSLEHKAEVQQLRQLVRDAQGVLQAGRDRLDMSYLQDRSWSLTDWQTRYMQHGLLGPLVRRLIWSIDQQAVLIEGDTLVNVAGKTLSFGRTAEVRLWHPADESVIYVEQWRKELERRQITQPFKQAHREVYLLTDAERKTSVYSNRFAAHLLRQHQFNALCGVRGWHHQLRLAVDADRTPPYRVLKPWNLRVEFWVSEVGGEYGTDTNEIGTFLYLTTDQLRFYSMNQAQMEAHAKGAAYRRIQRLGPLEEQPIPLEQVPKLVFSEALRDVDLFVGVASVGNDPYWADQGRDAHQREYWYDYSFGKLNESAQMRQSVLMELVPRLKIASRCKVEDRFLVVTGNNRTYKIHLGSGNILMEPGGQYLCIVPKTPSLSTKNQEKIYLPFEGDQTLAIIISKAFLLAEDDKITDPQIRGQINL